MSLIRFSPFEMMPDPGALIPPVDVYETETAVVVESPVPGVEVDKISVSVADGVLTIRGEDERSSEVDEKNYYRKEVRHGSFSRSVALPVNVLGDKAETSVEKGILRISIPKADLKK
ncbi:Hsp20/alpha crystallin family protein [Patescibacteria group bacterium]|nr:MAG: Hsp20/alpha crystallin family protein [Patescibacteria group bacterium]